MSQWTHFLGIIRFDSMIMNVWPKPPEPEKEALREVSIIYNVFQLGETPAGSEGSLRVDTILTKRGPTVIITGDLRDFGYEDLPQVVNWVNNRYKSIKDAFTEQRRITFIRDVYINCEVEHNKDHIVIEYNDDGVFELKTYISKEE